MADRSAQIRVIRVIRVPIQASETLEKETMKQEGKHGSRGMDSHADDTDDADFHGF